MIYFPFNFWNYNSSMGPDNLKSKCGIPFMFAVCEFFCWCYFPLLILTVFSSAGLRLWVVKTTLLRTWEIIWVGNTVSKCALSQSTEKDWSGCCFEQMEGKYWKSVHCWGWDWLTALKGGSLSCCTAEPNAGNCSAGIRVALWQGTTEGEQGAIT